MSYEDPILRKVQEILDKDGPSDLRGKWNIGDSLNVNASSLPMGFISYDTERISDVSNANLRNNSAIVVTVAVDMKAEFESPVDRSESHEQVIGYLNPKDEKTFQMKPDGVMGCLRRHQDMGSGENFWIQTEGESEIDYGLGIEKRGPGVMTAEGKIRVTITFDQLKPEFYAE